MDNLKKPIVAVVLGAAIAASLVVARVDKKKDAECVIPKCDASEKEVDCRRVIKNSLVRPDGAYWVGCTVMPANESVGSECEPAACFVIAGEELKKE